MYLYFAPSCFRLAALGAGILSHSEQYLLVLLLAYLEVLFYIYNWIIGICYLLVVDDNWSVFQLNYLALTNTERSTLRHMDVTDDQAQLILATLGAVTRSQSSQQSSSYNGFGFNFQQLLQRNLMTFISLD